MWSNGGPVCIASVSKLAPPDASSCDVNDTRRPGLFHSSSFANAAASMPEGGPSGAIWLHQIKCGLLTHATSDLRTLRIVSDVTVR